MFDAFCSLEQGGFLTRGRNGYNAALARTIRRAAGTLQDATLRGFTQLYAIGERNTGGRNRRHKTQRFTRLTQQILTRTQRFTLVQTTPERDTGGGRKTLDALAQIDPLMAGDTLTLGRLGQLPGLQQRAGQDGSGGRIRGGRNWERNRHY